MPKTSIRQGGNLLNIQNLANRLAIQSRHIPTIKIIDNGLDDSWFDLMVACQESAHENKADLIELLYFYGQEGEEEQDGLIAPVWVELVASDDWNQEIHDTFWKLWDGDFDALSSAVNETYNFYYPLP